MRLGRKTILFGATVLCWVLYVVTTHRSVYTSFTDPKSDYEAVVTVKSYRLLLPMMPGGSSDKPGYVEVFDQNSQSLGEMPVPMVQLAQIEWLNAGARIKLIGEWDFEAGTCIYWDQDGQKTACKTRSVL